MQCTCSSGYCKMCSMIKGIVFILLGALYWAEYIEIKVFLSLLVIFMALGCFKKSC